MHLLLWTASDETAQNLQDNVYDCLKTVESWGWWDKSLLWRIKARDMAEITIKLANSYQTSLRRAEEEKLKQAAAVQQLPWVWCVQSTTEAVVWKQLLLAHIDTEIITITTLWSRMWDPGRFWR